MFNNIGDMNIKPLTILRVIRHSFTMVLVMVLLQTIVQQKRSFFHSELCKIVDLDTAEQEDSNEENFLDEKLKLQILIVNNYKFISVSLSTIQYLNNTYKNHSLEVNSPPPEFI